MKRICWTCLLVFVFVLCWTITYAGDFYVIPCMKKNFAPVPKTGQTKCYNEAGDEIPDCSGTGQDGDHQKGVAWPEPRFTDNGNGTVTDNLTGLIWLKDSTGMGTKTWTEALAACNGLAEGDCGLTDGSVAGDWRLPNRFELESLLDLSQIDPALPDGHPFLGYWPSVYWSSSTDVGYPDYAWTVGFGYGGVDGYYKANSYYVRCVRSGR